MRPSQGPPPFLQLSAHPVRWSLLRELSRGDHLVDELAVLTGQAQNLVSYHLGKLRAANLVTARRSSRDAREVYYRLNTARCAELYAEAGAAIHPALASDFRRWDEPRAVPGPVTNGVLFLCTENSARSQMAEGFLRHLSLGTVDVESAGSLPGRVHPLALRSMRERGIDISGQRSKHIAELAGRVFDLVITVCDKERERCPEFPNTPDLLHWSIADPAASAEEDVAFADAAAEIEERVCLLLPALSA